MFFFLDDCKKSKIRTFKGRNLFGFPDNYVVLDLETTGLDSRFDNILEIGALKVKNNKIVDEFQCLCIPDSLSMVNDFIQKLTGITPEMLISEAIEPEVAIKKFLDFLEDDLIIGYNVHFDINFLYDECLSRELPLLKNDLIDVMRFTKRFFKGLNNYKQITVANELKIDIQGSHRAIKDCLVTNEIYQYIKNQVGTSEIDIKNFNGKLNSSLSIKDITTKNTDFNEDHPFYKKVCIFTGTLEKMPRKDAMQKVVDLGGKNGNNVTKKTNFLILGNNDYCPLIKDPDGKSIKHKKAEKLKSEGQDIEIISENVFYDMLEL